MPILFGMKSKMFIDPFIQKNTHFWSNLRQSLCPSDQTSHTFVWCQRHWFSTSCLEILLIDSFHLRWAAKRKIFQKIQHYANRSSWPGWRSLPFTLLSPAWNGFKSICLCWDHFERRAQLGYEWDSKQCYFLVMYERSKIGFFLTKSSHFLQDRQCCI